MRKFGVSLSEFGKWDYNKQKSYALGFLFNSRDKGETQIICRSELISLGEVESILELLHSQYQDLGMTIDIHKSWYQTLFKWLNPLYSAIDCETFLGAYRGIFAANQSQGRIDLFAYNHKPYNKKHEAAIIRLCIAYDIFHEVRHAFQRVYKEKKYYNCTRNYISGAKVGYSEQWVERDANGFAQRMMNNNKDRINEILDIKFSWDCTWGMLSTQSNSSKGSQLHTVDILKALKAGKKLRQSYWKKDSYVKMSEDGRIMSRGTGWARPDTPYVFFYTAIYSGRWSIAE